MFNIIQLNMFIIRTFFSKIRTIDLKYEFLHIINYYYFVYILYMYVYICDIYCIYIIIKK